MKVVKATAEEARIKMRRERDEIQKLINLLTEDEKFRAKELMQKQVDAFNKEVTEMVEKKEAEINE
jgi:ribosome recycling factor